MEVRLPFIYYLASDFETQLMSALPKDQVKYLGSVFCGGI